MTIGQYSQIIHAIIVEVSDRHGYSYLQLQVFIYIIIFAVCPLMLHIVVLQQAFAFAEHRQGITFVAVIPFLNLTARITCTIVALRCIDQEALLAVSVKIAGNNIQKAAVLIGRDIEVIAIIHVAEAADLYSTSASRIVFRCGIDDPQISLFIIVRDTHKCHVIPATAAGGVKGYCLHQAVVGIRIKAAVRAALISGKGGQGT